MWWSTKKYTKFRQKYKIKYRYYDKKQLENEEFNLKEQLVDLSSYNSVIYGLVSVVFGGYFSLLQIEQFRKAIGIVIGGALTVLILAVIFNIYHCYKNKQYRLRLEILEREKRRRKVKIIINAKWSEPQNLDKIKY